MQIITFGRITEIVGEKLLVIEDVQDTDKLRYWLLERYPAIATVHYAMAINEEMVDGNTIIHDDDTVALLPPFSGG